jgi:uncharacterized protein
VSPKIPMLARLALLISLASCGPAAGAATGAQEEAADPDGATARDSDLITVELATVGVDAAQHSPVVLLREPVSGKIVPIWVGIPEAQAILAVMLGIEMPRPMTHDLLASVIAELGATVEEVLVHDIRETTYLGRLRLRVGAEPEIREVDSRPSDALALAIRTDAPIRVAELLLADPPAFDFLAPEADEQVVRMLGATVVAPSATLRTRYHLPDRPGLVVAGASGEAAAKGLRRGDFILQVNGVVPREPMDFLNAALASRDVVHIRYWREGQELEVELVPSVTPGREQRRGPTPVQT